MPEAHSDALNDKDSKIEDSAANPGSLSDNGQAELIKRGTKAYSDHDYPAAIGYLEKAIANNPQAWKAAACLGLSYFHEKRLSEAQETFARIVSDCPDDEIVVRAVQALDKVKAAIGAPSDDDNMLRSHAETGVHLGLNKRAEDGEYDPQATGAFSKKDLPVADREKYIQWGTNCYMGGKFEKAIEYLEQALSGDDENWNARLMLGMSYYKTGQTNLAEIVIGAIMSQCTDAKMLLRAKQALENIHVSEMEISRGASTRFEEMLATKEHQKHLQQKKTLQKIPTLASQAKAAAPESKTERSAHRRNAMIALLCALLIFVTYEGSISLLPSMYGSVLVPNNTKLSSVDSFGVIDGITSQPETMSGPNASKLFGAYYEKPGSSKLVIIHPATFNDLNRRKDLTAALLAAGFSVLDYDRRGHGRSDGSSAWQGVPDDGMFAYDYAHGKLHYKEADIISYGCSVGAATAAQTASARQHYAVVLENPFTSTTALAKQKNSLLGIYPDSVSPEPKMDFLQKGAPAMPVLVVASKDPIVPAAETQAFFDKLGGTKELVKTDASVDAPHWDQITKFLQK
jgi:tetratricopeptide (TPR) repeat protein/pimeloyl-ACP methyl ester carboxylesterase